MLRKHSFCISGEKFETEIETENPVARDQCHLTGKPTRLAQDRITLTVRKNYVSFVPLIWQNFSWYDCDLTFEKLSKIAPRNSMGKKGDDNIAKSSKSKSVCKSTIF